MFNITNLMENANVNINEEKGPFTVIAHSKDLSVDPQTASSAYFASKMNVLKRQLVVNLTQTGGIILQKGAMQWMVGNVNQTSGVKGVGDFAKKLLSSKVTGESAIKPEYTGDGILVTEPTYKHLIILDVGADFRGNVTLEDGLFMCAENRLKLKTVSRKSISSALAGGEGLFNLSLAGEGLAVVESNVPMQELVIIDLENDTIKIDGSYAVAWSTSLEFTVERSGKTLIGSAASGEGLVNVYRGTGRIWMAPL